MAKDMSFSYLLDFYAPALTEKQREIVEMYYYNDYSLAEIADNCGITRQGARDAIKRSETIINDLEYRLGFAKQYEQTKAELEKISVLAKKIIKENSQYGTNDYIHRYAENILKSVNNIALEDSENTD
ncbi:MAG: DNA-binding protein [Oscillospiraceae bacterium]|nr:DNA-binding protein [Oscillospiraceae bacterium]